MLIFQYEFDLDEKFSVYFDSLEMARRLLRHQMRQLAKSFCGDEVNGRCRTWNFRVPNHGLKHVLAMQQSRFLNSKIHVAETDDLRFLDDQTVKNMPNIK
jgi:hypothetical protein